MLRKSYNYIRGTVRIHVTGSYPERLLNLCSRNGIAFWNLVPGTIGEFTVTIYAEDFIRLHRFAAKCRCKAKILRKDGARFTARKLRRRYALLLGTVLLFVLCFSFSNYVWTFEVTGNETVSADRILAALAREGIVPGVRADAVHPENIRNHVLLDLDELVWLTVTVQGTHAVVDVRERIPQPAIIPEDILCDVVASEDGLVTQVIARAGYPTIKKNELARKGDILISHSVPVRNTELTQTVHAYGDVYARVWRTAKAVTPLCVRQKHYTGRFLQKWALIFGSERINISRNCGNPYMECDKIIDRYEMTVGSLSLPVCLVRETYVEYESSAGQIDAETASACGLETARLLLAERTDDGNLTELSADTETNGSVVSVSVTAECTVSIGETRRVEKNE